MLAPQKYTYGYLEYLKGFLTVQEVTDECKKETVSDECIKEPGVRTMKESNTENVNITTI